MLFYFHLTKVQFVEKIFLHMRLDVLTYFIARKCEEEKKVALVWFQIQKKP